MRFSDTKSDDVLYRAICEGDWEKSRDLLKHFETATTTTPRNDTTGISPHSLYQACSRNAPIDILESLHKLDPDQAHHIILGSQTTILYGACQWSSETTVTFLLRVAPQTAAIPHGNHGELPLHNAVRYRWMCPSIVRRLLIAHPTAVYAADGMFGGTPLGEGIWQFRQQYDRQDDHNNNTTTTYRRLLDDDGGDVTTLRCLIQTFLLLLMAWTHGKMLSGDDEDSDPLSLPKDVVWLPMHDALRIKAVNIPPLLLRRLDQTVSLKCVQFDAKGNFPLHITCAQSEGRCKEDKYNRNYQINSHI